MTRVTSYSSQKTLQDLSGVQLSCWEESVPVVSLLEALNGWGMEKGMSFIMAILKRWSEPVSEPLEVRWAKKPVHYS